MLWNARYSSLLALTAAACLLATGCGSEQKSPIPLKKVTGEVTYKGQPLAEGTITLMPVAGSNTSTGEIKEGKFELSTFRPGDGVPPGEYTVAISSWSTLPGMGTDGVRAIPEKYFETSRSGLTATIGADNEQKLKFDLTE